MPDVAIIFFGLARSTRFTIDSIRANVLDPNDRPGLETVRVCSLNMIDRIHNPRSKEVNARLDPADQFLLDCDSYLICRQSEDDIAAHLALAQRQADFFHDGWASTRNLLFQLLSLKRAWALAQSVLPRRFDYYMFARPDLKYLDPVDFGDIISRLPRRNSIAVPAWQPFGGLNDRFAFADAEAAAHYANRLDCVEGYCRQRPLHSERLLLHAMRQGGCCVVPLGLRAQRIRADGRHRGEDFSVPG
jgi:hypothetical protein